MGVNPKAPFPRRITLTKEDPMKRRTLAIAGSIAALSFAAAPVAAVAATPHHSTHTAARVDRSRDLRDGRHVDRTPDRTSVDTSRDIPDR
jgi:hypothetical protein